MTTIELKGFVGLIIGIGPVSRVEHVAGKCLDSRGRKNHGKFGDMSTTVDAGQALLYAIAESFEQVETDELAIVRTDGVAMPRIRHKVGHSFGGDDIELGIDGDAQLQVMHRSACRTNAGCKFDVARLDVRNVRVEIPQAVVASVRFDLDCACVL